MRERLHAEQVSKLSSLEYKTLAPQRYLYAKNTPKRKNAFSRSAPRVREEA